MDDLIQNNTPQEEVENLKKFILEAEEKLESAKEALFRITGEDIGAYTPQKPSKSGTLSAKTSADGKIIEGIFNGENMIGPDGKIFPVPANYASKSKLVEGDKLKLTIAEDGSFIFKQIGPVERKKIIGELFFEDNMYHVQADGKRYELLYAAVTFHKAKPGDKVTIVVPAAAPSTWSALENVIHDVAPLQNADPPVATVPNYEEVGAAEESLTEIPSGVYEQKEQIPQSEGNSSGKASLGEFSPAAPEPSIPDSLTNVTQSLPTETPAAQSPYINSTPSVPVIEEKTALEESQGSQNTLPEESFLPRTQADTSNSLGESTEQAPPISGEATELEI